MTDRGGRTRLSPRLPKPVQLLRVLPLAGLLAVTVPTAISVAAGATSPLSSEQAKATQLEAEIQRTGEQIDALDQRYEAAVEKKASLDARISATQAQVDRSSSAIAKDRTVLHEAAIEAYVTGGTSAATDALFSTSQTSAMDSEVYNQVLTGDLNTSVADLHTAIAQLDAQRLTLRAEDAQAARAVATARAATQQAQTLEGREDASLAQVKGRIAALIAQQQAAADAAARAAAQAEITAAAMAPATPAPATAAPAVAAVPSTPAAAVSPVAATATQASPPPAVGDAGGAAVRAAETQLGVPYVW
ncbi:MAG TPA: hypothetical protein VMD28_07475, partial [Acidimicrobiales bacterium]|nr:hypothetical protein [Acidimicrobiales bacterium]